MPEMADHTSIARKRLDISYADGSKAQKMDVYLPPEGDGPFPCIAFIHGGAFMMCDKADSQVQPFLQATDRGYVVASLNYRLSGEAIFPAGIMDCKAALRYLRAHAADLLIDPGRIAVAGGSSGANYAAMLCATAGMEAFEDLSMGNAEHSSAPQAGIAWFPPTDFLRMDAQLAESGLGPCDHNEADSPESRYMGGQITKLDPDYVQRGNPMTHITPSIPPMLLMHGLRDHVVPYQQSVILAERIRQVADEDRVQLVLLETADHADPQFETDENMRRVFDFLARHL